MERLVKYAVVIPARNEEKYIGKTLSALKKQTIPPSQIIVVDDGSRDRTNQIASKYAHVIIRLPDRGYSVLGRPELSKVINAGLKKVEKDVNYVLICSADNMLPEDFFRTMVLKMKRNPKLVVASARAKGEPYFEYSPRGGSRVVDAKFWRKVGDLQYPIAWGWEPWLSFKAMQLGYEARAFRDVVTTPQRSTGLGRPRVMQSKFWGKSMYALGYDWKYGLGRCVLTFLRSPKAGLNMFLGWLLHQDVDRLDVAEWVNQMQRNIFWKRVRTIIKRGGRR
ncbi:MAG: glycosyltransferase family 2 protein [Candidatus Bathyarchaeota archaeon]|nr:MAG: glycosyltransferase family 2 protein [Candidatus Bathyarchaeota archaeon]